MMSKFEARKHGGEDSGNRKLLNEIQAISKALHSDGNASRASIPTGITEQKPIGKAGLIESKSKNRFTGEDPSRKDKKSLWNWKALKAFSFVRHRRFTCSFSLQVHSIVDLGPSFDDVSLCVHWRRRDVALATSAVQVLDGTAEFEETLRHVCSVYGSRSGPHHSANYEAKHFLLYVTVAAMPELDLGKHRIDLTRLLPLTLEELEEEKSSGKWTTSFKLSGKASGATLNVSFGYMVVGDSSTASAPSQNLIGASDMKLKNRNMVRSVNKSDLNDDKATIRCSGSLPELVNNQSNASSYSVNQIKDLHEILPASRSELASSVDMLYKKFDQEKLDTSFDFKPKFDVQNQHFDSVKPLHPDFVKPGKMVSESDTDNVEHEHQESEFSSSEHGIKLYSDEQKDDGEVDEMAAAVLGVVTPQIVETEPGIVVSSEQSIELPSQSDDDDDTRNLQTVPDYSVRDSQCSKESLRRELELALNNVSNLEKAVDSPEFQEDHMGITTTCETNEKGISFTMDDVSECVATEFLDMLGIEHSPLSLSGGSEPESPRERLLRQFENDVLAGDCSLFDFDKDDWTQPVFGTGRDEILESSCDASTSFVLGNGYDDFDLSSFIQAAEQEHQTDAHLMSKNRAKILEDMETEALMREWGLNEKAFQHSPREKSGGFGSPYDLPPEVPAELPPLGEGLGPFLQTKNGGFVRSMNPSLFSNAKRGGSLIMQVSSPVVVPAEMGSGTTEILQRLASDGIEKLSMQANKLMPLEDITGKTMEQVAWEAAPTLPEPESQYLQDETDVGTETFNGLEKVEGSSSGRKPKKAISSSAHETSSDYVSLEDLAPFAMDKIEALSIEGLRIQSGMSDTDAPLNINAQSIGNMSSLQGKGVGIGGSLGLEGTAGLQLLDIKENVDDVDGLMGLSLTLDEWIKLDSGEIGDEDQISERTSKILAAHHANSLHSIRGGSKGDKKRGRRYGLLGNNFTVALMVQLRDPLRNYEAVGAPMLALIQVERVFVPPKPKIYSTVSELNANSKEEDDSEAVVQQDAKEKIKEEQTSQVEGIPQFKVTEVHVAGFKTEPGKKSFWGTKTQQQSGSRWLVANGMGKTDKHPLLKSKAASTTKEQPVNSLWSISSRAPRGGTKWK